MIREPMTRERLAEKLDEIGLSATVKALILLLADEYAAHLIDDWASSPRSQGGAGKAAPVLPLRGVGG